MPERELSETLRGLDWRFLLSGAERPRVIDLRGGPADPGLSLAGDVLTRSNGGADVAVVGFPDGGVLAAARRSLAEGGEVVCIWSRPLPGGPALARARLRRAGFAEPSLHWPGPRPRRRPEFWAPLGDQRVWELLRSQRGGPGRPAGRALALAGGAGALAPICAVAGAEGGGSPRGAAGAPGPSPGRLLLLTGGSRSANTVIGMGVGEGDAGEVVKFARLAGSDDTLDREAAILRRLEEERPELEGVPRVRGEGRRAGRRAIAQTRLPGRPLNLLLGGSGFATHAEAVCGWLAALAQNPSPTPRSGRTAALAEEELARFGERFAGMLEPGTVGRMRALLAELPDLPPAWEHRDLDPWNVVVAGDGAIGVTDWEGARAAGLPGLDPILFLHVASLIAGGAVHPNGRPAPGTDPRGEALASRRGLAGGSAAVGATAARCLSGYGARLGLGPAGLGRLRLLCWIAQASSNHVPGRRYSTESRGPHPLDSDHFVALALAELEHLEAAP